MTVVAPAVRRGRTLTGRFVPPGDKSITHRAVLFGLLAEGTTRIADPNTGEDCARSLAAAGALGAEAASEGHTWVVRGRGHALASPRASIDCGNSGTTMRLLAGIAAAQRFDTCLHGDASLERRPMARVIEPLARMGAAIDCAEGGRPSLAVHGRPLYGIEHRAAVASAQVATCVVLAGLLARGITRVRLPGPARDHTERMLPAFGVAVDVEPAERGARTVSVQGGARLHGCELRVPGDFSAAAFALAAAAATPGAEVTAQQVGLNPTRTGLLDVLAAMGAEVTIERRAEQAGEPVGDVTVRGPAVLRPFDVPPEWVPRLVDEVPAWVIAASAAGGTSSISGAAELRVKESDRIAALARNLAAVGIEAHEHPDGIAVRGGAVHGAHLESYLDHRIVMAFAALATRAEGAMTFDDVGSVATSYPDFFATLAALGAGVEERAS